MHLPPPARGAVEVRIVGTDSGQFGTAIIDEVALALVRERPLELLVDAAQGSIMSVTVTTAWARFFELNRDHLQRVTVLAISKPMALAMGLSATSPGPATSSGSTPSARRTRGRKATLASSTKL